MTIDPAPAARPSAVVDIAPLLAALRDARGLCAPLEVETDADAEAVAALWGLAAGAAGSVRHRAAVALWRLGVAPGAPIPCGQPGDVVGQCIALRLDCRRCEFNPGNAEGAV